DNSAGCSVQHALGGLYVHALDHLIAEAFGASVEGSYEGLSALDLGGTRSESPVTGTNLVGVDQALAVEAEPPPRLRLLEETFGVFKAVEHAVERRNSRGARREQNQLQRG